VLSKGLLALAGGLFATAAWAEGTAGLRRPPAGGDVSFDAKSFLIGERRLLLRCGGVHYFRLAPEEWRDRLLQTRLAGFNALETPVPWNLHQPTRDAELVLDGAADLGRFLDLCRDLKLLALVRIGPYVNAGVTSGGLPAWLADDPKLLIRAADERYLRAVHGYWAKLLPILLARQAPAGPVALVQIEDHYRGPDDRYLLRLYDEVKNSGFRVPIVLSELHPCKDFQQARTTDTALFATTELMPAGPVAWGERSKAFEGLGQILIEGLARGLDGFNHSMWAAGTNLALLPASSFPTRHEAPTSGLLEGGGLSPVFAEAKSANLFAQAFESVFTQATTLSAHPLLDQGRRAGLVAYGRTDGQTALLFLKRRYGEGALALADPATGETAALATNPRELRHVVVSYPLTPKTTLALSTAQVLTIQPYPDKRVLVVHAPEKTEAVMVFRTPKAPAVRAGADALAWNEKAQQLTLRWKCSAKGERRDFLLDADVPIHVIALEESQVGQAWVLDGAGILIGPARIGEWATGDKTSVELRMPTRRVRQAVTFYPTAPLRGVAKAAGVSDVQCDETARRIDLRLDLEVMEPLTLFLRKWETADDLAEATPDFADTAWRDTLRPLPLGEGRHGWYRCRFQAAKAATRKLSLESIADAATVYLNGQCIGQSTTKRLMDGPRAFPHPAQFDLPVKAGDNVLAILLKNWGCYSNALSYGVPLAPASAWGILGGLALDGQPPGRWRQHEGLEPAGQSFAWKPVDTAPGAKPAAKGAPVRWFRATFAPRKQAVQPAARLHLKGVSYGAFWLNGRFAGLYSQAGAESGLGYRLPTPWLRDQNELILLEEGGQEPTECEVRFDRNDTYLPFTLEFTAEPTPAAAPKAKGRP